MQQIVDFLKPLLSQGLISTAAAHGVSLEGLLCISLAFLLLLVWLLYTMSRPSKLIAINPKEYRSFELIDIVEIGTDTKRLKFSLQSPEHVLGLPIGQHISFRITNDEGKEVTRSYTPISSDDDLGWVEFVIKIYHPNVHPAYPAGGVMTCHLDNMKVGDRMDMRGPKGNLDYKGQGKYTWAKHNEYNHAKFGFVAGGSGLTPCLQVIRAMLKNPDDTSEIWLLFANKTEEDILMRAELDALAKQHKKRFHLHYTLDSPPKKGWKGSVGFVNEEMCAKALPGVGPDSVVFMCGPGPMCKATQSALEKLGYDKSKWFVF